jgi:hypothetical protein
MTPLVELDFFGTPTTKKADGTEVAHEAFVSNMHAAKPAG